MRRWSSVLAVLVVLVLGLPGTALAEPPSRVDTAVEDRAGVLAPGGAAAIAQATSRLRSANGLQLFVVYVDSFDGADPVAWAEESARLSQLGIADVLLAVAVEDRAYGTSVDRDAFHWWLVQKTLQWGIGCMGQAAAHLGGLVRSVELAAIGRRVAEQEWDLIELLAPDAWAEARTTSDEPVEPEPGLHGQPTAAELLDAARTFLSDTVLGATSGQVSFHTRVTANVLGIVERQLLLGPAQEVRFRSGLADLGVTSAAELCDAIRGGGFDDRQAELWRVLAASVRDRLAVANPRHLALPTPR